MDPLSRNMVALVLKQSISHSMPISNRMMLVMRFARHRAIRKLHPIQKNKVGKRRHLCAPASEGLPVAVDHRMGIGQNSQKIVRQNILETLTKVGHVIHK